MDRKKSKSKRCPQCGWGMNRLYVRHLKSIKPIGWLCKNCLHREIDGDEGSH